jgi:hemoglobin-like flavoprotein
MIDGSRSTAEMALISAVLIDECVAGGLLDLVIHAFFFPSKEVERMIDPEDISAIRKGWSVAAASPETVALRFYAHLFDIDASSEALFHGDMRLQGRKLTETLNFIVDELDDLSTLVPAAEDLAVRHVAYAVVPEHYESVGAALIATLRELLGSQFTAADEAAWVRVYGVLSNVMCKRAYG